MSPFEIFLDAQISLCNDPEWLDVDDAHPYPQTIHLAHSLLDRARLHLGIRLVEGGSHSSVTERLMETLA